MRLTALGLALAAAVAQPVQAGGLIRDAEVEATLDKLSEPVLRAAGMGPGSIDILIMNDRNPNAFVFDGRHMVVSTGLLTEFKDPRQLQGVMAHELGHINGGHLARRHIAMNNLKGPAMISMIVGLAAAAAGAMAGAGSAAGAGVALAAGAQNPLQRALLAYNRSEESAADQAGMTYLQRAQIDPTGMQQVLERFRGQEVFSGRYIDPYAQTHPVSSERLSMIRKRVEESPYKGKAPDPDLTYWTQRMDAKLEAFLNPPASTLSRIPDGDRSEIAMLKRAIALHRAPDPEAAIKAVDALIAMRPKDPYYNELKGQILLESGRAAEAVKAYRIAVSLAPNEPLIQGALGRALLALNSNGANAEALAALEKGYRDSDGGDPSMLRDLAFAYARTGQEGMAALITAERMMMTNQPRDARNMAERAKGLLRKGTPAWLRADDIVAVTGRLARAE